VNNPHLQSKEMLDLLATSSLEELKVRYNGMLIHQSLNQHKNIICLSLHDFIKENYKKYLLFYTVNHPSKILVNYICEILVNLLGVNNTIRYELDMFNNIRCLLYKCVQNAVHFDIGQYTPYLEGNETVERVCDLYYKIYSRNTNPTLEIQLQ